MFPHSAIAQTRPPRSADASMMSRSLNPQYDGLAYGLSHGAGARHVRDTLMGGPGNNTDHSLMSR